MLSYTGGEVGSLVRIVDCLSPNDTWHLQVILRNSRFMSVVSEIKKLLEWVKTLESAIVWLQGDFDSFSVFWQQLYKPHNDGLTNGEARGLI